MKRDEENLARIRSPWRRLIVSFLLDCLIGIGFFVDPHTLYAFRSWLNRLTPRRLVYPAMLAQFLAFVCTIWLEVERALPFLLITNLIIAGIVMLPSTLPRRQSMHWVSRGKYP